MADDTVRRTPINEPTLDFAVRNRGTNPEDPGEDPSAAPPFVPTYTFNERSVNFGLKTLAPGPPWPQLQGAGGIPSGHGNKFSVSLWYKFVGNTKNFPRPLQSNPSNSTTRSRWQVLIDEFERMSLGIFDKDTGALFKQYISTVQTTGFWHHYLWTYNGPGTGDEDEVVQIYVDGVNLNGPGYYGAGLNFVDNAGDIEEVSTIYNLGSGFPTPTEATSCEGHEYRPAVWNKVLTPAEVTEIFNANSDDSKHYFSNFGNYVSAGNLVHYWPFRTVENRFRDEGTILATRQDVDAGTINDTQSPEWNVDVPT